VSSSAARGRAAPWAGQCSAAGGRPAARAPCGLRLHPPQRCAARLGP
jgi:hypothetical protein